MQSEAPQQPRNATSRRSCCSLTASDRGRIARRQPDIAQPVRGSVRPVQDKEGVRSILSCNDLACCGAPTCDARELKFTYQG